MIFYERELGVSVGIAYRTVSAFSKVTFWGWLKNSSRLGQFHPKWHRMPTLLLPSIAHLIVELYEGGN